MSSPLNPSQRAAVRHLDGPALEEGVLPHREAIDAGNIDEERRLMYVGLTRAEESVHLLYCRTRKRAGERIALVPSRFIGELVQEDLRHADLPRTADEAAHEKAQGASRLKALRALVRRCFCERDACYFAADTM